MNILNKQCQNKIYINGYEKVYGEHETEQLLQRLHFTISCKSKTKGKKIDES